MIIDAFIGVSLLAVAISGYMFKRAAYRLIHVLEEANKEANETLKQNYKFWTDAAMKAAYEDAAKIADEGHTDGWSGRTIANQIRARAKEVLSGNSAGKAVKQPSVEPPSDYCFWEQNEPIGKMKAAYGYDRDTWPEGPECVCPKCVRKAGK